MHEPRMPYDDGAEDRREYEEPREPDELSIEELEEAAGGTGGNEPEPPAINAAC